MKRASTLAILLLALTGAAAFAAQPPPDPALLAPVNAWGDAFNAAQTTFPQTAFTEDCIVIDEFPPFAWSSTGETARTWYARVVGADSPHDRALTLAAKERVSFDAPSYTRVRGDRAYLVFPSTLTYVEKGTLHVQKGTFVVVERKTDAGWRISANSWAVDSDG